jgi:Asp-tRNA(Asn)/Glu-tRNA(Gln) amidotransferase A subunit family amidase
LPLYGVPFGVKDSIDIKRVPTTLSCPDYAYVASTTAPWYSACSVEVDEADIVAGGLSTVRVDQLARARR